MNAAITCGQHAAGAQERLDVFGLLFSAREFARVRAGLDDFFQQTDGVTLIEWFERLETANMAHIANAVIQFEVTGDNERKIIDENPRA